MNFMSNKKVLIGLFVIVGIAGIGGVFALKKKNQVASPEIKRTPSTQTQPRTQITVSPSPIASPLSFTGALDNEPPASNSTQVAQEFLLRKELPIKSSQYSLDYDERNFVYVVTLKTPYAENKAAFQAWIKQAYNKLPADLFEYHFEE